MHRRSEVIGLDRHLRFATTDVKKPLQRLFYRRIGQRTLIVAVHQQVGFQHLPAQLALVE